MAPILMLIGLGMLLRRAGVLDEATVAGLKRLIVTVSLPAVLFTTFLGTRFEPAHVWHALFTLMVLPPPFIVPLFVPASRRDDLRYVNNVLSLSSLVSVAVFVGYVLLTGA